jgi:molybdopterin molybdotransferase
MALLSVEEALARIVSDCAITQPETVALADAHRRTLAADLTATLTQPPFDASAMDGYAVRKGDVQSLPATLKVIAQSAAGHAATVRVETGQAVRIFTGAPVSDGADAIVIQENTARDGDTVTVLEGTPEPGHIRPQGMDFSQGEVLLTAGHRLNARSLTLAAAMGHGTVSVLKKPRVAIIATGDELVMPGDMPGPSQILCSNPFGVAAMVEMAGGVANVIGIARDTQDDLERKIQKASEADILVTIGGASVGDHDLVAPALESQGMQLDFWRIAMRPGKPLLFGRLNRQRVLGFPGNPVSSLICARVFLVPLVQAMLGHEHQTTALECAAQLDCDLESNGPRQHYMRAKITGTSDGIVRVTPMPSQDSSLLSPLARADGLIVRPPHAPAQAKGSTVVMLKLDY